MYLITLRAVQHYTPCTPSKCASSFYECQQSLYYYFVEVGRWTSSWPSSALNGPGWAGGWIVAKRDLARALSSGAPAAPGRLWFIISSVQDTMNWYLVNFFLAVQFLSTDSYKAEHLPDLYHPLQCCISKQRLALSSPSLWCFLSPALSPVERTGFFWPSL